MKAKIHYLGKYNTDIQDLTIENLMDFPAKTTHEDAEVDDAYAPTACPPDSIIPSESILRHIINLPLVPEFAVVGSEIILRVEIESGKFCIIPKALVIGVWRVKEGNFDIIIEPQPIKLKNQDKEFVEVYAESPMLAFLKDLQEVLKKHNARIGDYEDYKVWAAVGDRTLFIPNQPENEPVDVWQGTLFEGIE